MKKILLTALAIVSVVGAMAQNKLSVPMGIYIDAGASNVPTHAQSVLENKMKQIVTINGVGTSDNSQFFITCFVNDLEKHVLGGAPIKHVQTSEISFYIADAQNQRIYETVTFTSEGIGNSESEAYLNVFKQIDARSSSISKFIANANEKIIDYYESQLEFIAAEAESLAKLGQFGAAFNLLCYVPRECENYEVIEEIALAIYQMQIDESSLKALQRARAAWASGHNAECALEAASHLAEVSFYSSCYCDADALANEIKAFAIDEHFYNREQLEKHFDWMRNHEDKKLDAWRDVGVAYGRNQQPTNYRLWW